MVDSEASVVLRSLSGIAQEGSLPYVGEGIEAGEWPIVLTHRAFRRLCKLSGEDANTFGIALRKIRSGHPPDPASFY